MIEDAKHSLGKKVTAKTLRKGNGKLFILVRIESLSMFLIVQPISFVNIAIFVGQTPSPRFLSGIVSITHVAKLAWNANGDEGEPVSSAATSNCWLLIVADSWAAQVL
jgi:hypothetical protein